MFGCCCDVVVGNGVCACLCLFKYVCMYVSMHVCMLVVVMVGW